MSNEEAIRELLKANGIRHFIIETIDYGNIDVVEYKEYLKLKEVLDKIKEYCKNTINRYEDYIGKEDIVRENKFILELLEEIEYE